MRVSSARNLDDRQRDVALLKPLLARTRDSDFGSKLIAAHRSLGKIYAFRGDIDLSLCEELPAGRSDYRFGQADDGGKKVIAHLGRLVRSAGR